MQYYCSTNIDYVLRHLIVDSRALPCPLFKVAQILGLDGDGGKRGRSLEHGARQEVQLQGTPVLFLKEAVAR